MVTSTRPPLPIRHANPHIPPTLKSGSLPPVKYQILNCQGQDILVGRLKIETPTPSGHAFILRRFDTGAISLTTMFRAAFPNAPEYEEKGELQWVKDNYDLSGNNGGPQNPSITRLAGTWVSPNLAQTLGKAYSLGDIITTVIEAEPDPTANYRRSAKSSSTPTTKANADPPLSKSVSPSKAAATLPTPSPTGVQPNPPKRRKETTPIPLPAPTPPTSPTKVLPPRRTSRTRSPGIRSAPIAPLTTVTRTARVTRSTRRDERAETPEATETTIVEEDSVVVEEGVAGAELHEQDIAEQQALVEKLKAEKRAKEAAEKAVVVDDDDDDDDEESAADSSNATKMKRARTDEDEELKEIRFNPKEPEVGERAIATNSRVGRFELQPRTRQLAWGAAAFAFGTVAAAFLPSFL